MRTLLLFLLLLATPAAAQAPADDPRFQDAFLDSRHHELHVGFRFHDGDHPTNPSWASWTYPSRPHNWDVVTQTSHLEWSFTSRLSGSSVLATEAVLRLEFRQIGETDLMFSSTQCSMLVQRGSGQVSGDHTSFHVVCPQFEHIFEPGATYQWRVIRIGANQPFGTTTHTLKIVTTETVDVTTKPTAFETLTGLTALEFAIFPTLAIIGVFLWTRNDLGIRLLGIALVLLDLALIYSFYAASKGSWPGLLVLGFILLLAAAWMSVHLARDQGGHRRAAA